jgi:pentatricopeptide repeat protein
MTRRKKEHPVKSPNHGRAIKGSAKPGPTAPSQLRKQAKALIATGDFREAQTILADLLGENPMDSRSIALLMKAYAKGGRLEEAEALYKTSMDNGYACRELHKEMLLVFMEAGEPEDAMSAFRRIVETGRAPVNILCDFMKLLSEKGRLDLAREVYDNSASNLSVTPVVLTSMILTYAYARQMEKAEEIFWSAFGQIPYDSFVYNAMVRGFKVAGDVDRARIFLNLAISTQCCDTKLCLTMLYTYSDAGRYDALPEYLAHLTKHGWGRTEMFDKTMRIYTKASMIENAKQVCDIASKNGVFDDLMLHHIAHALARASRASEAVDFVIRHIREGPVSSKTIDKVINALYSAKKFGEILSFIEALPEDRQSRPYILLKKADALRKAKRYEDAIELVKETMDRNEFTEGKTHLALTIMAYSLKDSGRPAEAYEILIDLVKKIPEASRRLARAASGLVFAWDKLGRGPMLDGRARRYLLETLSLFKEETRTNLGADAKAAIAILRECNAS